MKSENLSLMITSSVDKQEVSVLNDLVIMSLLDSVNAFIKIELFVVMNCAQYFSTGCFFA